MSEIEKIRQRGDTLLVFSMLYALAEAFKEYPAVYTPQFAELHSMLIKRMIESVPIERTITDEMEAVS